MSSRLRIWFAASCAVAAMAACGRERTNPNPAGKSGADASGGRAGSSAGSSGRSGASGASGASGVGGGTAGMGGSGGASGTSGKGGALTTGGTGGTPVEGGAAGESGEAGASSSTGGTAGSPGGTAGTSGAAGSSGGSAGAPSLGQCTPGTEGGTPEICTFAIDCTPSAIPTVGVLDWSTDLAGLDGARVEFSLNDPAVDELNTGSGGPISIDGTTHRALLLGLKPNRTYTYRIVASAGATECTSPDMTFSTGSAARAPLLTTTTQNAAARARGFIVTSTGYPNLERVAYIIDSDGVIVWWAPSPPSCSRALMDWDGTTMWMLSLGSPSGGMTGQVMRIGMDGAGAEVVPGLEWTHHDFTVRPGGISTFLMWNSEDSFSSDVVERSPDGTLTTVATIDEDTVGYAMAPSTHHANAIQYHPTDDTYTVSDLVGGVYVKVTRQGAPVWQIGGDCANAVAPGCVDFDVTGNHGHHLLADGTFVFFVADTLRGASPVHQYSLSGEGASFTAMETWTYETTDKVSQVLGDTQRLPNGNTLVVYSTIGEMHEVTPAKELVQVTNSVRISQMTGEEVPSAFGYANFRETLYGPPIR